MIISRLRLTNWRNFAGVDLPLLDRAFVIGPNASGKSNLLDAVRFLRDVAMWEGGGLQAAVRRRGGVRQIRSLSAHSGGGVGVEVHLSRDSDESRSDESWDSDVPSEWVYRLVFDGGDAGGRRAAAVVEERVEHRGEVLLQRPDGDDAADPELLTETALEQTGANRKFRAVAEFFDAVAYMHLVPQLVRYGAEIGGGRLDGDPFGQGFLDRVADTEVKVRQSRLKKIAYSLSHIVPQLEEITFARDRNTGQPHLKARFGHWRADDVWQREEQFSDGTLRLIGLFWALLERDGPLLLEDPEMSLHRDIVRRLAPLVYRLSVPVRRRRGDERYKEQRQVMLTTHSPDLLFDPGIDGWEVICVIPGKDGSVAKPLAADDRIRKILEAGVVASEVALFRNSAVQLPMHLGLSV